MVCPWSAWEPGSVAFCEQRLCAFVAEPSNAWSSFAYIIGALYLLMRPEARASWLLVGVALADMLIGIGSFFFHASGTFAGELVDLAGMFLLSGMMLALVLGQLLQLSQARVGLLWVFFTCAPLLIVFFAIKPAGIPLFALELTSAIGLEIWLGYKSKSPQFRYFLQSIGMVVLAFTAWSLDKSGIACNPDNHLVTGHAIWHVLNAIAIMRLFSFYASRLATQGSLKLPVVRPLSMAS